MTHRRQGPTRAISFMRKLKISIPTVSRICPIRVGQRPTTEGSSPKLRTPIYPYVALHCPTYRENSHANHTVAPAIALNRLY
jgi:hypothetical protein